LKRWPGSAFIQAWVVPGGVNEPLSVEKRDKLLAQIPEVIAIAQKALAWFQNRIREIPRRDRTFANFPSLFMDWSSR